jgi:hypothetical protein
MHTYDATDGQHTTSVSHSHGVVTVGDRLNSLAFHVHSRVLSEWRTRFSHLRGESENYSGCAGFAVLT